MLVKKQNKLQKILRELSNDDAAIGNYDEVVAGDYYVELSSTNSSL